MRKKLFLSIIFACLGITAEIIFTGFKYNLFLPILHHEKINYALTGNSYVWMIFIYGAIPFLFPFVYTRIKNLHLIFRLVIYALICLAIEYISGWLLDLTTGDCPWQYTVGWHLNGYIRIDYFPLWIIFGFVVEKSWIYLNKHFL